LAAPFVVGGLVFLLAAVAVVRLRGHAAPAQDGRSRSAEPM
jgi:hypothetical protein